MTLKFGSDFLDRAPKDWVTTRSFIYIYRQTDRQIDRYIHTHTHMHIHTYIYIYIQMHIYDFTKIENFCTSKDMIKKKKR